MQTIYDWITVLIFAGLLTQFLSRSVALDEQADSLWHYIIPAVLCALANWLGNEGHDLAAVFVIFCALAFIAHTRGWLAFWREH